MCNIWSKFIESQESQSYMKEMWKEANVINKYSKYTGVFNYGKSQHYRIKVQPHDLDNTYKIFELIDFDNVKVIMFVSDTSLFYNGLVYDFPEYDEIVNGIRKLSKTNDMYKREYKYINNIINNVINNQGFCKYHGRIECWINQGVMPININLMFKTPMVNYFYFYRKYLYIFFSHLISLLDRVTDKKIIFCFLGREAQILSPCVVNINSHYVIKENDIILPCNNRVNYIFNKVNYILNSIGEKRIIW